MQSTLVPGSVLPINAPIEITFDREVDLDTVNFSSFSIQALPPATAGAPLAGPVSGTFFLKDSKTVVFQPACPTDSSNSNGGLLPGNLFGQVTYLLTIPSAADASGSVIAALDGGKNASTFSLEFRTPSPPYAPLLDQVPGPPQVTGVASLPTQLGLNLLIDPNPAISISLNQPVLASSIDDDAIQITFDHLGSTIRIPASVTLAENCNAQGGSVLSVVARGVLPSGKLLTFWLSKTVSGFGLGDHLFSDEAFHTAAVAPAATPEQKDAVLEEFLDSGDLDESAPFLTPFANWGNGALQAAPLAPTNVNAGVEIRIGPGTPNQSSIVFSTDGTSTLKDMNSFPVQFQNGVIQVEKFTIINGGSMQAIGSQPLRILCSDRFFMDTTAKLTVSGQASPDVSSVCSGAGTNAFGSGNCGGGDGGKPSPSTSQADIKGGDGNGAFQILAEGGKGGHSGYWTGMPPGIPCGSLQTNEFPNFYNLRPGGGGGGNWGIWEFLNGDFYNVCYSVTPSGSLPCLSAGDCVYPLDACPANTQITACLGLTKSNSSRGEPGAVGVATAIDALIGTSPPLGGPAGPAIFSDSTKFNDFLGRKPIGNQVVDGEIHTMLGGQGGGAGGDGIGYSSYSPINFNNNLSGGGGGGGGGIVEIQATQEIRIRGTIEANGGNGGAGEMVVNVNGVDHQGGGGGGGGAGGMIILESASIVLGSASSLEAIGGNRSTGSGTMANAPTFPGGCNSGNMACKRNCNANRGGAGGKGVILMRVGFDANATQDCDGIAPAEPAIESGALGIENGSPTPTWISCERDANLTPRCDPDPHAVIRSFGANSQARSRWYDTGQASLYQAAEFSFDGVDPGTGIVDTNASPLLASGSGGALLGPDAVQVTSAALADLVRSAPKILIGDSFRPSPGAAPVAIVSAQVVGNAVSLFLAGNVSSIDSWELRRRTYEALVDGQASSYPSGLGSAILKFQGGNEDLANPGQVDPNSLSAFSPDPGVLSGFRYLRYQVEFQSPGTAGSPQLGCGRLKIPYKF